MSDNNYNSLLETRKIDVLFRQAPIALFGSFIVAIILYLLVIQEHITGPLIAWFVIYTLLSLSRLAVVFGYRRKVFESVSSQTALKLYAISTIFAGFMWGLLSVYLLQILDNELIYFMLICLVGLTAASVTTYSTSRICFLFFMLPASAPLTISLFLQDDQILNATGILLLLYTATLFLSSIRVNSMMVKALKFEIIHKKLADEKQQVSLLNEDLKSEIEKHSLTEEKLLNEKTKAQLLTDQLIKLSSQDGLTKINNRRAFDEYLINEWNRALRNRSSLALILCDIDFFKFYNDTYGHQSGDNCLCKIATILESNARRAGDFSARYGGEEFAVILPNTKMDIAENIAEQIRQTILNLKIPHASSKINDYITISCGVSTLVPEKNQTSALLVGLADKALYQSKMAGKNITTCCGSRYVNV